jgi:hypothetical protein
MRGAYVTTKGGQQLVAVEEQVISSPEFSAYDLNTNWSIRNLESISHYFRVAQLFSEGSSS